MLSPTVVQQLWLNSELEILALRTVRTDVTHPQGLKVNFKISPKTHIYNSRSGSCGANLLCSDASETICPPAWNTTEVVRQSTATSVAWQIMYTSYSHGANPQRTHSYPRCPKVGPARSRKVCDRSDISTTMSLYRILQSR